MHNPFDALEERLRGIEAMLAEIMSMPRNDVPIEDKLLTIEEAGALVHLTKPTIYGLVHTGDIPHSKKGKRLYFSQKDLLNWIYTGRRKTRIEIEAEADSFLLRKSKRG
jgi:excisionase family DNA binding protein